MVFLELRRDSRVTTGNSGCLLCWPRQVQSSIRVAKESWGLLSSDCRAKRPHLGLCPEASVPLEGDRDFGELCGSHQGCQVPFRPPIPNVGLLLLRRCSGKGLHLAMTGEPRGFSRVTSGFSSYDGAFRLPLVLGQASPIFHASCEGKLSFALE